MERKETQPKSQKKYIAAALLGFTLTIGGVATAIVGNERRSDESAKNSRAIGALENNYGAKFNRPTEDQLDEAVDFVQNLVNKIDDGQNIQESDEALSVTKELISNQNQIEKYDAVLEREENFQEKIERTISAAGLKDTDDANKYTELAGWGTVILGSLTTLSASLGALKKEGETQE